MPPDRLAQPAVAGGTVDDAAIAQRTECAVLAVLAGAPLADAAGTEGLEPADLAEAIEVYRRAGRHALQQHAASDWWQLYIEFADWATTEQTFAGHLVPLLERAEDQRLITAWWFMRKAPCWRLRLHPGPARHTMKPRLGAAFDALVADGRITRWWAGRYEAETAAFGGTTGMKLAHELFCGDSRAVARLVRAGDSEVGLGRREVSLLLCSILLRAAGLEWYEQGDVWHRVAQERPLPPDVPTAKLTGMAGDLKQLLLADTTPNGPLLGAIGPLASAAGWADVFRRAGQTLGAAARAGSLQRGLRDTLSYHVLFHWNRIGLPTRTQSILAWAARSAILDQPTLSASTLPPARPALTAETHRSPRRW